MSDKTETRELTNDQLDALRRWAQANVEFTQSIITGIGSAAALDEFTEDERLKIMSMAADHYRAFEIVSRLMTEPSYDRAGVLRIMYAVMSQPVSPGGAAA